MIAFTSASAPWSSEAHGWLVRSTPVSETGVFAMGGHEDGVIAFGASAAEAGGRLVRVLSLALES